MNLKGSDRSEPRRLARHGPHRPCPTPREFQIAPSPRLLLSGVFHRRQGCLLHPKRRQHDERDLPQKLRQRLGSPLRDLVLDHHEDPGADRLDYDLGRRHSYLKQGRRRA